jgi:hypothetical protein
VTPGASCPNRILRTREDFTLIAKHKLNAAYFQGAVVLAGAAGLVTQSWAVFFIVLALLVATALASRDIRP